MQNKKSLKDEIQVVNTLSELIKTYEEVYMLKMYRTRNSVVNTRDYYTRILKLYQEIKLSYKQDVLSKVEDKKKDQNVLIKNDKQVAVFISGDDRFAGEINKKVFFEYIEYFRLNKPDLVVIGLIGKNLMAQRFSSLKFKYFNLTEDFGVSSTEELKPIVDYLISYTDVRVFYGQFENMMKQVPKNSSITGDLTDLTSIKKKKENAEQDKSYFLSEPSLFEILTFFETQIFASLFKRGVEEATLAQIGARVSTLESSVYSIDKRLNLLRFQNLKSNKHMKNKKQQGLLVGINFWEGQNAR